MKRALYFAIVIAFLFPASPTVFAKQSIDIQVHREKVEAKNQINVRYEFLAGFVPAKLFPAGHPQTAVSDTFGWGYGSYIDYFKIYAWRQDGYVWVEIEPLLGDEPFICSPSFVIIQKGVQYDTVKLVTVSGDSQCGEIYVTSVFELSQWSFYDNPADLSKAFTLLFDGGENTCTLDIEADPNPPAQPSSSGGEDEGGGGCLIATAASGFRMTN